MNVQLVLIVILFAVTWANETSLRHSGGHGGGHGSGHGSGHGGGHGGGGGNHGGHGCVDRYGCCRYIHYPYYFRQCCYYNRCCPSCRITTKPPVTVVPTTTTPPLTTTPEPAQCEDKLGCCKLMNRPLLYIKCIKENGCAPLCGGLGFIIKPTCTEGRECCVFPFLSSDFNKCCTYYGCCPPCKNSDKKCKARDKCKDVGGVCKKKCDDDEEQLKERRTCKGKKCKCCVTKEIVITPDCMNATECCTYEPGTGEFYKCCAKYNCCPTCAVSGCPFGNETYSDGEVVRSYPEKCFDLRCSLTTISEAPYYISQITEYKHADSCSCCLLAGKMYADGYLLTDDDYCIAVQCVEGEWVNQGYLNANCRICQIQTPLMAFKTFDGTSYVYGEDKCRYSMVQTPKDPSTSYIHTEFVAGTGQTGAGTGYYNEQLYFQDEGAAEVSCPASDPVNDCDYGPVTTTPEEITSVGTLGFVWAPGTLPYSIIMGVNKITTMYSDNSLLIMAPQSMYNELEGLCGEYNGDKSDDLIMSTGQTTTDGKLFVESWHSTQSDSSCSLLGLPDAGTRHLEVIAAAIQGQLHRHHNERNNTLAVGNCDSIEDDTVLEAYYGACRAYLKNHTNAHRSLWAQHRNGDFKDEQMDLCMQVSCLCPEVQDECLNVFKSMNTLLEEMEMRTLDPEEISKLLERGTCKNPVTGTFKPETTPEMKSTTHDDSDQKTIGF